MNMKRKESPAPFLLVVAAGTFIVIATFIFLYQAKGPASSQRTNFAGLEQADEADKMVGVTPIEADNDTLIASLIDVSGGDSFGTAYVLRKDGKLIHKVIASLPAPEGNNFYEGWLIQQEPTQKIFSTGVMTTNEDGRYVLEYQTGSTYEGYNFVVITLETVKDDTPEEHILEGTAEIIRNR